MTVKPTVKRAQPVADALAQKIRVALAETVFFAQVFDFDDGVGHEKVQSLEQRAES